MAVGLLAGDIGTGCPVGAVSFLGQKKFFEKRKYAKGTAALSVRARSRKQPLPSTGAGMSGRDAATHGPPPGSERGRAAEIRSRRNSCFLLN